MTQTVENPAAASTRGQRLATQLSAVVSDETRVLANEPLARRTTFRVGGPADVYVEPPSEADLAMVLDFCAHADEPDQRHSA